MKRLITCLLAFLMLFTLAGCGGNTDTAKEAPVATPSNDPYTRLHNMLMSGNKLVGIAYLGEFFQEGDAFLEELAQKDYFYDYPFVQEITNVVEREGNQLFCLVPADSSVTVSVYAYDLNENGFPVIGEKLISTNEPVLVKGNPDAYTSNLYMTAEIANWKTEYLLVRSGIEGKLENFDNSVFDFTPYHVLPEFRNLATEDKPLCSNWSGVLYDAAGNEIILMLYIHESGEARFIYGNEENPAMERFIGTWTMDGDRLHLSLEGGETVFGAETYQKDITFRWKMPDIDMFLTHIGGDELLSGTKGDTFQFWNND